MQTKLSEITNCLSDFLHLPDAGEGIGVQEDSMPTSHMYKLQTKPAIATPAELIILIALHLNAIYGKIPVGKGVCVTFPNDNLKK
jgi:hypothetical protein